MLILNQQRYNNDINSKSNLQYFKLSISHSRSIFDIKILLENISL